MMWRNNPFILGILFFATCILQPVLQFNPSAAQDTVIIGNAPDQSVEIDFKTLDQITNTVTIPDLFLRSGRLKYNQSLVKSQNEGKNISMVKMMRKKIKIYCLNSLLYNPPQSHPSTKELILIR